MSDPQNNWIKIETEEEVIIPTSDGKGIAEKIKVKVPAYRDPKTDEIYLDGEALRMLDDVKTRHLGLLTTEQIKLLRQRLDCTQQQMSELLQIGEKTWTRWESGRERPSKSLNLLLRALFEGRVDAPWLEAQREPAQQTYNFANCLHPVRYHGCFSISEIISVALDEANTLPGFTNAETQRSIWMKMAIALGHEGITQPFRQIMMHYDNIAGATENTQTNAAALWSRRNQSVKTPNMEISA
jgi:DNA-binding transcriptional regulator YiaG